MGQTAAEARRYKNICLVIAMKMIIKWTWLYDDKDQIEEEQEEEMGEITTTNQIF